MSSIYSCLTRFIPILEEKFGFEVTAIPVCAWHYHYNFYKKLENGEPDYAYNNDKPIAETHYTEIPEEGTFTGVMLKLIMNKNLEI